eukprot:gb/GECG01009690.1/.p1 GENE.gb/GECG01009690.1/~~gb/GECG01009690.1/.p1  ORF type:complete len:519 (+),score=131.05 gb/GECG01009690.1/:1-1557(+)
MNQSDFRQLLASSSVKRTPNSGNNDDGAAASGGQQERKKPGSKKGRGPPKKQSDENEEADDEKQRKLLKEKYRDRAKERREQKTGGEEDSKGEPEITEEQMAHIDYEKSKYLGGDAEHTHLVKGLDFKLAEKIRREQLEQQQQRHQQQHAAGSHASRQRINKGMQEAMGVSRVNRPVQFNTHLGSTIYRLVNETLSDNSKSSGLGVTRSGRHEDRFLPGRTAFEFDLGDDPDDLESVCRLPTLITRPKEDIAEADDGMCVQCPRDIVDRLSEIMSGLPSNRRSRTKLVNTGELPEGTPKWKTDTKAHQSPQTATSQKPVIDEDDDIFEDAGDYFGRSFVKKAQEDEDEEDDDDQDDILRDADFGFFDNKEQVEEEEEGSKEGSELQTSGSSNTQQKKASSSSKDEQNKRLQEKLKQVEYEEFLPTAGAATTNLSTVVYDSEEDEDPFKLAQESKQQLRSTLEMANAEEQQQNSNKKRKPDPKLEQKKENARKKSKFENELKSVEKKIEEKRAKKQEKQ